MPDICTAIEVTCAKLCDYEALCKTEDQQQTPFKDLSTVVPTVVPTGVPTGAPTVLAISLNLVIMRFIYK